MKLYLSSYDPYGISTALPELVGENKRTAMIANANDDCADDDRSAMVARELADLTALGLEPFEIDLRDHVGDVPSLRQAIGESGLVWARGGNAFLLRRSMRMSGFDQIVHSLVRSGVVYGGYSAGAVVASSTMRGMELVDDAHDIVPPYSADVVWDGLGLVPYSVAPHFRSDHPQTREIDDAVIYWQLHGLPFRTLRDGESLVIDGDSERIVDTWIQQQTR